MTVFPNYGHSDKQIIMRLLQRLDGVHHLNQVCWGMETSKTRRTGQPEDKDWETLPYWYHN